MERFEEFLNERKYLLNVSPKTLRYYHCAFQAWRKHGGEAKQWVVNMREADISPVSVNTYICAMNAYWKWNGENIKLAYLKEEQKILTTLSADQIAALVRYKAVGTNLLRAHMVALAILDTGLRISETLSLRQENINLEELSILVIGKGGKHRLVPFSKELRARLFRYMSHRKQDYLFETRSARKVSVRNIDRDFVALFEKAGVEGIRATPPTLRHSFAVCYLRNGGNLDFLRRLLGHSSLITTQKYLRSLGVEDLGAVHNSLSPLSARR